MNKSNEDTAIRSDLVIDEEVEEEFGERSEDLENEFEEIGTLVAQNDNGSCIVDVTQVVNDQEPPEPKKYWKKDNAKKHRKKDNAKKHKKKDNAKKHRKRNMLAIMIWRKVIPSPYYLVSSFLSAPRDISLPPSLSLYHVVDL